MTRVVVVGDAFLDRDIGGVVERVAPDAPVPVVDADSTKVRPGGAALAADLLAADGVQVRLVTAIGDDAAGDRLRDLLAGAGVHVVDVGLRGTTPQKVRIRSRGQSLLRLDHGSGSPAGAPPESALADADAILVSDYGRGMSAIAQVRSRLRTGTRRASLVWDPHLRGRSPVPGATLVTPNAAEAAALSGITGDGMRATVLRADRLAQAWRAAGVAVTLGSRGALLGGTGHGPLVVPAPVVTHADTCGAGDRFAGAATAALAKGCVLSEAVHAGVAAASRFVAAGAAAAWPHTPSKQTGRVEDVVARTRREGGSIVATGGCFDLLHAGHVAMLRAARSLGDCLVVLLNSDRSVRRLKGQGRPLQREQDRRAVLEAIDAVDAVVVFDGDTPEHALARLRPDVFVKGGDYTAADLPEAAVVARWGGQAVTVPYLDGRSTSRLLEQAVRRDER
jgi:rfaE bifunctional protein nucleotidyltransferase chain/domain/rfaE bifunctional protein kinase chain/domain